VCKGDGETVCRMMFFLSCGANSRSLPNLRRPMSAYLCFANARRGAVKAQNPDCSNGEISRLLAEMWKNTPDDIKQPFKHEEKAKWEAYKQGMKEWRKTHDRRKNSSVNKHGSGRVKKKQSKAADDDFGPIDTESGFDEQLGLQGMDPSENPNPEEMMAASALRGVRDGQQLNATGFDLSPFPQAHGSYATWFNTGTGIPANMNGMNPVAGNTNLTTTISGSFNPMELSNFAYNQYGNYSIGSINPEAAIMAQLRGSTNSYHQLYQPSFLSE
jgi:hypothetical protein